MRYLSIFQPQYYSFLPAAESRLWKLFGRLAMVASLVMPMVASSVSAQEQKVLPFELSNPGHKRWSPDEAVKIYDSACALVARTIRPEKPPRLHPKFTLVLGASDDQVVRTDVAAEVHLKTWNPDKFSEAVVILVAREVLRPDDLRTIAVESLRSAAATASVEELRKDR